MFKIAAKTTNLIASLMIKLFFILLAFLTAQILIAYIFGALSILTVLATLFGLHGTLIAWFKSDRMAWKFRALARA